MLCAVACDNLVPLLEPPPFDPPPLCEPPPLPEPPFELVPVPVPELPLLELPLDDGFVALWAVMFPAPFPELSLEPMLDKSENIGLSLFVSPYAATAAAIHSTTIIEIIKFDLSNFSPPI